MTTRRPSKGGRTLDDWRRMVFRTRITDSVKVLLLWMGDKPKTTSSGWVVCEPRTSMATALGVSERRIDERIKVARERGFLTLVRPGYTGHVAEYGLTFPDPEPVPDRPAQRPQRARDSVAHSEAESASSTSALSTPDSVALSERERARDSVAPQVSRKPTFTACEPCSGYGCALCCGEESAS